MTPLRKNGDSLKENSHTASRTPAFEVDRGIGRIRLMHRDERCLVFDNSFVAWTFTR